MIDFNRGFKTEDKELEKITKEAETAIKLTGDIARVCISLEQFKTYKKNYQAAEEKMVNVLLKLTAVFSSGKMDLTTYGAKMLIYMTRLKDLRSLLEVVINDSKKGLDKKNE